MGRVVMRPEAIADVPSWYGVDEAPDNRLSENEMTAWLEFLDSFYGMDDAQRMNSLCKEPQRARPFLDAWLAATAEQLSANFRFPAPPWTLGDERRLERPWFAAKSAMLRAVLLAESPTAFRRRGLFVSANAMNRSSLLRARPNHGRPPPLPLNAQRPDDVTIRL